MRLDVLLDLLTSLTLHLAERDGQLVAAAVFEADATYRARGGPARLRRGDLDQSGEYLIAA